MSSSETKHTFLSPSRETNYPTSAIILRLIGYVMIALFILDVVTLLLPLNLMNPDWEFQTAGDIVERTVIPTIGLGLIFLGEDDFRRSIEMLLLKALSWISLIIGIVFIIILPLVLVTSSQRIAIDIDTSLGEQYQQQISQTQAIQEQIESASTRDLAALIDSQDIDNQGEALDVETPEDVRQKLLSNLVEARLQFQIQVQDEINQQKSDVREKAVKWILGSFVSGSLFVYIWHLTQWARAFRISNIFQSPKKKKHES